MKFTLKHIFWFVTFAALFSCAIALSVDSYRKAKRQQEIARARAEEKAAEEMLAAWRDSRLIGNVPPPPMDLIFVRGKIIVESFSAKVVSITDGDTINVLTDSKEQIKIRLDSIDCPEKNQPFCKKAKQATSDLVFGKTVDVLKTGKNRYGRTLAFVILDHDTDASVYLVENGFAWNYVEYSKSEKLAELEADAREKKVGLWADSDPVPPWEWRKKK